VAVAFAGTVAKTTWSSSLATPTLNQPTGRTAGEGLLAIIAFDQNGTMSTTSTGWVKILQVTNGTTVTTAVFYKKNAAGGAADDLAVTTTLAERGAAMITRLTGQDTTIDCDTTGANNATGSADPPNHTPAGGSKEYLWVAAAGTDQEVAVTAAPSGYTDFSNQVGPTSGASVGWAGKIATASAENPATFTQVSNEWCAFTIAIPPAGGGAPPFVPRRRRDRDMIYLRF
jgi:hypothetical protein